MKNSTKESSTKTDGIRDLSDFCTEWANREGLVSEDALAESHLSPTQRDTIRWMRLLTSRICLDPDQVRTQTE